MGWPGTYTTQCVFKKKGMTLQPEDIMKDLISSIERDGHPIDNVSEKKIEFYYEPKVEGIARYMRGNHGIKIPVRCIIEQKENVDTIIFDFSANILKGFLFWNIGLTCMFLLITHTLPFGSDYVLALGIFGFIACMTNLIGYLNISNTFSDFTKYRLFWKYLNKK